MSGATGSGDAYAALRTETLAEVYEQFFAIENLPGKVADGAFYTPSYLVDYIVDETDGIKPFDGTSLVCDPAVGSGAFLVAAFRRIVEREVGSKRATVPQLQGLLQRCIHGFETNAQAANVARLSLLPTRNSALCRP
jgi:type I restriction-modification system DNA methylase subunit